MLPVKLSVGKVFSNGYYYKMLLFNIVMTFVMNFLITSHAVSSDLSKAVLYNSDKLNDIVWFFLIVCPLLFFSSGSIRQRILDGHSAAISGEAIRRSVIGSTIFFSSRFANWKVRYPCFLLNALLLCGSCVVGLLYGLCHVQKIGGICNVPPEPFAIVDASWKAACVAVMYSMNFLAAHNSDQQELQVKSASPTNSKKQK